MIQIKKDTGDFPADYLAYITSKRYRKTDFDEGQNSSQNGREIFKKIKKKKTEFKSLKAKLLNDQGFVCCYCNERVVLNGSSVEHIVTIDSDKSLLAEYSNLLIACNGGRIDRAANPEQMEMYPLYCDAHRNNSTLPFCPLDALCESAFSFSYVDGSITGNHPDGKAVICILNLDCDNLRRKRMDAYTLIFDDDENFVTEQEMETIWDNLWERDTDNKHARFFFPLLNVIYDII